MKKITIASGILALLGVLAIPVFAHGPFGGGRGWSGGPGNCWQDNRAGDDLTEAQRAELNKLDQQFYTETAELRREIWSKSDELNMALDVSDPDPGKVKALHGEISQLKAKMAEHKIDYELKARRIAPKTEFARGPGRGYGWHMKGYGSSRGGGYGPGSCWN
jgi:zinc resistance-associated protein